MREGSQVGAGSDDDVRWSVNPFHGAGKQLTAGQFDRRPFVARRCPAPAEVIPAWLGSWHLPCHLDGPASHFLDRGIGSLCSCFGVMIADGCMQRSPQTLGQAFGQRLGEPGATRSKLPFFQAIACAPSWRGCPPPLLSSHFRRNAPANTESVKEDEFCLPWRSRRQGAPAPAPGAGVACLPTAAALRDGLH